MRTKSNERETETLTTLIGKETQLLNDIRNTKGYKALEGYRHLKMTKGVEKIKALGQVLKYVRGEMNCHIQSYDPMEEVLRFQAEIKERLEHINSKLNICQDYLGVYQSIQKAKDSGKGVLCIFAPYEQMHMPDGYARRIKNIDDLLGDEFFRIYIAKDSSINSTLPECTVKTDKYISLLYDINNTEHCLFISLITHWVGIAYIHSVYQALMPVVENEKIVKIYDFHGVVPEELDYMNHEKEAAYYGKLEEELVKNSDYIIVANQAMKTHIISKYSMCKAEFVLLPMNNDDNSSTIVMKKSICEENKIDEVVEPPVVIYAGGLQKWQLIPEMQDAICKQKDRCEFHMYVSDTDEFLRLWGDRAIPQNWEVTTKTPDELRKDYRYAQYGFVLRDDFIVNNVACPTKLIDYIKFDIIPIMKSPYIGDFERHGLGYLSLQDFLEGRFFSERKRKEVCENNRLIITKILKEYDDGSRRVKEIVNKICVNIKWSNVCGENE